VRTTRPGRRGSADRWRRLALAGALAVLAAGCAAAAPPAGMAELAAQRAATGAPEYPIQPGDTLTLKFAYHPEHDQEVVVRPDGKLLLPLVGEVQAAGRTAPDLAADLERLYARNLREPRIAVGIKSVNERRVYVGGEVHKPGFVPYREGLTALRAVMEAGGPTPNARMRTVVLLQNGTGDRYRATRVDLVRVLKEGDTNADPVLAPADVVFVPQTVIARLDQLVDQYIMKLLPIRPGMGFGL